MKKGGHGGARPNSGPKSKQKLELIEARETIVELQGLIKGGLQKIGEEFPRIVDKEVELALRDNPNLDGERLSMQSRHFLIKTVLESVRLQDMEDSPLEKLFEGWRATEVKLERVVGTKSAGPIIDVEGEIIS